MIKFWFAHVPELVKGPHLRGRGIPLSFQEYPQLETLRDHGATVPQLQKCQKGFELFKKFEESGFPSYTNKLIEGCIKILETKKADPQHFSVFFGLTGCLIRHKGLTSDEIVPFADFQADLIRKNYPPSQVRFVIEQKYGVSGIYE